MLLWRQFGARMTTILRNQCCPRLLSCLDLICWEMLQFLTARNSILAPWVQVLRPLWPLIHQPQIQIKLNKISIQSTLLLLTFFHSHPLNNVSQRAQKNAGNWMLFLNSIILVSHSRLAIVKTESYFHQNKSFIAFSREFYIFHCYEYMISWLHNLFYVVQKIVIISFYCFGLHVYVYAVSVLLVCLQIYPCLYCIIFVVYNMYSGKLFMRNQVMFSRFPFGASIYLGMNPILTPMTPVALRILVHRLVGIPFLSFLTTLISKGVYTKCSKIVEDESFVCVFPLSGYCLDSFYIPLLVSLWHDLTWSDSSYNFFHCLNLWFLFWLHFYRTVACNILGNYLFDKKL